MKSKPKKSGVRQIVELLGLALLAYGVWSQRNVLSKSFRIIGHASLIPLLICFSLAWLLFLWGALGYKVLLEKPIRLWHIILAQLSAAGPGRIVPGGAGQLSFGTLFLSKNGLNLAQALAVGVTNNLAGFIVNSLVLIIVFIAKPNLLKSLHLNVKSFVALAVVIGIILIVVLVARKNKRLKKGSNNTGKELKKLWRRLFANPPKLVKLTVIMLATISTNSLMLFLAAKAVGLPLPLSSALVVMSTGVALGSLVPTPGGVGGVEAGLIASMYALGFNLELATSAALLYRAATYLQPFIPGIGAYSYLRKKELI